MKNVTKSKAALRKLLQSARKHRGPLTVKVEGKAVTVCDGPEGLFFKVQDRASNHPEADHWGCGDRLTLEEAVEGTWKALERALEGLGEPW